MPPVVPPVVPLDPVVVPAVVAPVVPPPISVSGGGAILGLVGTGIGGAAEEYVPLVNVDDQTMLFPSDVQVG
jgi:hypothetical protein